MRAHTKDFVRVRDGIANIGDLRPLRNVLAAGGRRSGCDPVLRDTVERLLRVDVVRGGSQGGQRCRNRGPIVVIQSDTQRVQRCKDVIGREGIVRIAVIEDILCRPVGGEDGAIRGLDLAGL